MNQNPTRFDELKATGELPSPTGIALEILRLARRPETTAKDLTRIIQADPALTGKLLRLANSSFTGMSRPAASVAEAVVRLGMRTVSSVSLAFSIVGTARRGVCQGFDYDGFWTVSLARGAACAAINRRLRFASGEDGFTLGLLSHVGELALATVYPEPYTKILAKATNCDGRGALWAAEREVLGISSRDLSAAMLSDWGLPEVFVEAILYPAVDPQAPLASLPRAAQLSRVLEAAEQIGSHCVLSPQPASISPTPLAQWLTPLGILGPDADDFHRLLLDDWRPWGQLLAIPATPEHTPPRYLQPSPAAAPPPPAAEHAPMALAVVIADDDELQRQMMCRQLQAAGYEVRAAANGQEALELVLKQRPDVVIADWQMPLMNGLELCRTLRQSQFAQGLYLILVTAADDEDVLVDAYEAGVDDFVTKPLRPRAFQARMKAARRLIRLEAAYEAAQAEFRRVAGELAVANRKLEEAMLTDFLTGLPNRRYLVSRLEQQWAAAGRNQRDLSCLLLDVDHFKRINDKHGHDVGDVVLQRLADILRGAIRKPDIACRFGGEEFVVILPETNAEGACLIAERLRQTTESQLEGMVPGVDAAVTISIGVATRTEKTMTVDDILKRADEALYLAKSQGRNRVCRSDDKHPCPVTLETPVQLAAILA